jgi:hypothetical protein
MDLGGMQEYFGVSFLGYCIEKPRPKIPNVATFDV